MHTAFESRRRRIRAPEPLLPESGVAEATHRAVPATSAHGIEAPERACSTDPMHLERSPSEIRLLAPVAKRASPGRTDLAPQSRTGRTQILSCLPSEAALAQQCLPYKLADIDAVA